MHLFLNTNDVRVAPKEKDLRSKWGTCCTSSSMERRSVSRHRPWLLHSISLPNSSRACGRNFFFFLDIAWPYPKGKRRHTVTESSHSVDHKRSRHHVCCKLCWNIFCKETAGFQGCCSHSLHNTLSPLDSGTRITASPRQWGLPLSCRNSFFKDLLST